MIKEKLQQKLRELEVTRQEIEAEVEAQKVLRSQQSQELTRVQTELAAAEQKIVTLQEQLQRKTERIQTLELENENYKIKGKPQPTTHTRYQEGGYATGHGDPYGGLLGLGL